MKVLVVLENRFIKDREGNVWCDRIVDYNFLKRYLEVFEEVIVCGRVGYVDYIENRKLLVSGDRVSFIELPNFTGAYGTIMSYKKIKRIIKSNIAEIDCAILRAPSHLSLIIYKILLKKHKRFAIEFVMAANKMFEGKGIVSKLLNKFINNKAKKMCLKANGVSYVTERILQKEYPCTAIINKSSKEYFTESYSSIDLDENRFYKQNWKIDDKPNIFKIIHIGYMDSLRKGQDVLITAVKRVIEKGYNVELELVGDGKNRSKFEELSKELGIDKIVKFSGSINNRDEIFDKLKQSHLFVFPTQSEGLPRAIIEAMAVGLPCISSPVDGIPELLDDEYLIDYNDYEGYENKIIELMSDWKKMIEISNMNYEKAQRYNKKILDNKRKAFYKKLYKLSCERDEKSK